jgi:hypothetical protein
MKIIPKTQEEARKLVHDILHQGDKRYNAPEDEFLLADFILKEAISLEEKEVPNIEKPSQEDYKEFFNQVQGEEKYIAKELLKLEDFKENEIIFECSFHGSRPDVLAESTTQKRIIPVECCSCRINKIINYFSEEVDEIWVIVSGKPPWEKMNYIKDNVQWFVFEKGENWNKVFSEYKKQLREQIKKVPSPIDNLMKKEEDSN